MKTKILSGNLTVKPEIFPDFSEEDMIATNSMINLVIHNGMCNRTTDTLSQLQSFTSEKTFNTAVKKLNKMGILYSSVENNYAYLGLNEEFLLKFFSEKEILEKKLELKMSYYKLHKTESHSSSLVKVNKRVVKSGLKREGFSYASNLSFRYDIETMRNFIPEIANNILKKIELDNCDELNYGNITQFLLDYYCKESREYSLGQNISDSRGRAIFDCVHKLFNPVGCKDARALIELTPIELSEAGFRSVVMFVSELNGFKKGKISDKIAFGLQCIAEKRLPEPKGDDLHKHIWLLRIYRNLNDTKRWSVPVEMDATASAIQMMGLLTGEESFLRNTNILCDENELLDIWTVEGIKRDWVKKAITPLIYGSSLSPASSWTEHKYEYGLDHLTRMKAEIEKGKFQKAVQFKDFILENVSPKPVMDVAIWNDKFRIVCNKFRWDRVITKSYHVFDTIEQRMKTITRELNLVPDMKSFKRYFVTLLIHNIDSQVMNEICKLFKMADDFILPNHDAAVLHPNSAPQLQYAYTLQCKRVFRARKRILRKYFKSVNIHKHYDTNSLVNANNFTSYCLK